MWSRLSTYPAGIHVAKKYVPESDQGMYESGIAKYSLLSGGSA
jgi:hypothetical protein